MTIILYTKLDVTFHICDRMQLRFMLSVIIILNLGLYQKLHMPLKSHAHLISFADININVHVELDEWQFLLKSGGIQTRGE